MADEKENEIRRSIAVINMAIKHNMFSRGTMPESDGEKIDEAKKLVTMATQAKSLVDAVGASKVPAWPAIRDILIEAEVMAADATPQPVSEQPPSLPQTSSPVSPPPPPLPLVSPPAPTMSASAIPTVSSTVPADSSASPSPSSAQPTPETPGAWLSGPQPGETWSSMGAGEWVPLKLLEGGQVEARSVATGESTVLPAGFLKDKVKGVPATTTPIDPTQLTITTRPDGAAEFRVPTQSQPPAVPVIAQPQVPVQVQSPAPNPAPQVIPVPTVERIELKVVPTENKMLFTHPGCATWMVPLDGAPLPDLFTREECANCGMPFPLTSIDDGGYVYVPPTPLQPKEELSTSLPDSQPQASSPSLVTSPVQPTAPASIPESLPSPQPDSSGTSSTGAPVDDDEGDAAYAVLLDGVDGLFTPQHFPIPHDLEHPPELMPEDLTLGEVENRRLHSQYNALAARARYLWAIDHLKAKRCGRVVKTHMKPAMRAARSELGKDATVAEVKMLAEENELVVVWSARQDMHADRAEAYKEFFEIYAENVKTLSRDLTYAGTEQEGS